MKTACNKVEYPHIIWCSNVSKPMHLLRSMEVLAVTPLSSAHKAEREESGFHDRFVHLFVILARDMSASAVIPRERMRIGYIA